MYHCPSLPDVQCFKNCCFVYCLFWMSLVNYISRVSPVPCHFILPGSDIYNVVLDQRCYRRTVCVAACHVQALVLPWRSIQFTFSRSYTHLLNLIPAFPRMHLNAESYQTPSPLSSPHLSSCCHLCLEAASHFPLDKLLLILQSPKQLTPVL